MKAIAYLLGSLAIIAVILLLAFHLFWKGREL